MNLELVTAPASYPVTLVEAREHLRVTITDDDDYITGLIPVATDYVEDVCSNKFVEQTWRLYLDCFPEDSFIVLPFGMVISVTSVKYTDHEATQTVFDSASYTVDTVASPGKIDLAYSESWPSATLQPVNGVVIEFVTGYAVVPPKIEHAIKLYLTHLFENREPVLVSSFRASSATIIPLAIDSLLADYRMSWGF